MTLLTLTETAEMLKISPRTVRRLPIPRAYVGGQLRYDLSDVEAYVMSRKQGGQIKPSSRSPLSLTIKGSLPSPSRSEHIVQHRNPLYALKTGSQR